MAVGTGAPPRLGDIEAERGVGGKSLVVHPVEDRHPGIDVVMQLDVVLVVVDPEETTNVLDDAAL